MIKEKAKEAILDGAMEAYLHDSDSNGYEKSDIVNIEICESYQIDHSSDGFTGNFIRFWETSDDEVFHSGLVAKICRNRKEFYRLDQPTTYHETILHFIHGHV